MFLPLKSGANIAARSPLITRGKNIFRKEKKIERKNSIFNKKLIYPKRFSSLVSFFGKISFFLHFATRNSLRTFARSGVTAVTPKKEKNKPTFSKRENFQFFISKKGKIRKVLSQKEEKNGKKMKK